MNRFARLILFLSSYSPLFVIFACQLWSDSRWIAPTFLALAVIGLLGLWLLLRQTAEITPSTVTLREVSPLDGDVVGYLVTYLLPFLGVDFSKPEEALPFAVFLVLIGVLYVNSNMLYINPILNALKYHVYRIVTESGQPAALVSKRNFIPTGETLQLKRITNYVYME